MEKIIENGCERKCKTAGKDSSNLAAEFLNFTFEENDNRNFFDDLLKREWNHGNCLQNSQGID